MIISLKHLITTLDEEVDKRFYYYDIGANFDKRAMLVIIARKHGPIYQVSEELPFDSPSYTDKDYITWRIVELMQELREMGRA
jgi:hypothetical protein